MPVHAAATMSVTVANNSSTSAAGSSFAACSTLKLAFASTDWSSLRVRFPNTHPCSCVADATNMLDSLSRSASVALVSADMYMHPSSLFITIRPLAPVSATRWAFSKKVQFPRTAITMESSGVLESRLLQASSGSASHRSCSPSLVAGGCSPYGAAENQASEVFNLSWCRSVAQANRTQRIILLLKRTRT